MNNDSDYLVHYGVLGMKWGVRKDSYNKSLKKATKEASKNESKTLKDRQSELQSTYNKKVRSNSSKEMLVEGISGSTAMAVGMAITSSTMVGAAAFAGGYAATSLASTGYNWLKTNNIIKNQTDHDNDFHDDIKQGSKLYRSTTKQNDLPTGNMYVTYKQNDRNFYKGVYSNVLVKQQKGKYDLYENTYTPNKDLKVASYKQGQAVLNDLYKNNKKFKSEVNKSIQNSNKSDEYKKDKLAGLKNNKYDADHTTQIIAYSLGSSKYLQDTVTSTLKKNGFDAMVDIAGVGGNGTASNLREGDDPLIIFDTSTNLTQTKTDYVSVKDSAKAATKYKNVYKI